MPRWSALRVFSLLASILAAAGSVGAAEPAPSAVRAQLQLNQPFYYVGDGLEVRIKIVNGGMAEAVNPVKGPLLGAFAVSDAKGKQIESSSKTDAKEPARPDKLAPGASYAAVVDLTQMYPELKSRGRYTIKWSSGGVAADDISIVIIPKYLPSKDYLARVETEQGTFVIDLLKRQAPLAVKAFVDLANAGFYDGLIFYEARADQVISGGDPTGTGRGQAPLRYPAEMGAVPVVAGSVVLKPAGLAPPANSSQFAISLQSQPTWIGQFTVVGQVVEGLDIVRKLAGVPTADPPSYRPLKDIHTLHVTIQEKPAPARSATGSN